jgi:hypothetical protein
MRGGGLVSWMFEARTRLTARYGHGFEGDCVVCAVRVILPRLDAQVG